MYSAEELANTSPNELKSKIQSIISNDSLPTDSPDVFANLENSMLSLVTSPAGNVSSVVSQHTMDVVSDAVKGAVNDWWSFWQDSGAATDEYLNPDYGVPAIPEGYGAMMVRVTKFSETDITYRYYYCDYLEVYEENGETYCRVVGPYVAYDPKTGTYSDVNTWSHNQKLKDGITYVSSVSGDVRYIDNVDVPVVDLNVPTVGEAGGEEVTPDMLNPDGTVTIDGVTYYPYDYLDFDRFNDGAILGLLNGILAAIGNIGVIQQDDTSAGDIVGDVSVELDIAELNNLVAPPVIADVFPFCLPFDFVKGLRLLAADPVAPKFEVPFNIPSFGVFEGSENTITLDMEKYSKYFEVGRWAQVIIFMIGLCFISFKIIKGVH